MVRWTDGSNMSSDVLTKDMLADHLREALERGTWSIEFREEMVKTARRVARERWEFRVKKLAKDGVFTPGVLEP
eukprot:5181154-Pyramimonas_sp.AAC.1